MDKSDWPVAPVETAEVLADDHLIKLLQADGRSFTTADALRVGITERDLRVLLAAGKCARLRRGHYWTPPQDGQFGARRHLALASAVMADNAGQIALSHESAAVTAGLPVWGLRFGPVRVVRCGPGGRGTRGA